MDEQLDLFTDPPAPKCPCGCGEPAGQCQCPATACQALAPDVEVCRHGTGPFTNAGTAGAPMWVHAHPDCRRPTAGWLAAQEVTRC